MMPSMQTSVLTLTVGKDLEAGTRAAIDPYTGTLTPASEVQNPTMTWTLNRDCVEGETITLGM